MLRLELTIYCIYMNEETIECYLLVMVFTPHDVLAHLSPMAYSNERYASTTKAYARSLGVTCQIQGQCGAPSVLGYCGDCASLGRMRLEPALNILLCCLPFLQIRQQLTMVSLWPKLQTTVLTANHHPSRPHDPPRATRNEAPRTSPTSA